MKERLLQYIGCPHCRSGLQLEAYHRGGDEILEASLKCQVCEQKYLVHNGVPRLLPPEISPEKQATAAAFGWEWTRYVEMHPQYEEQFRGWIHPLQPEFFAGKIVLDAGCGIGRHMHFAAAYGAHEVIGMDLSAAVDTCFRNVGELPNVHVVQADIYNPPFQRLAPGGPFDFVYSIGVLHHLPDPRRGFESLLELVRPGGTIFAWVYGYENTGLVRVLVNPLRQHVTSRLPAGIVNVLALPLAIAVHGVARLVYRPLRRTHLFNLLPLHEYIHTLSTFSFRQNVNIVVDHLVAPITFYLKREEFEAWFVDNGLEDIEVSWRNQNSWRGRGRQPIQNVEDRHGLPGSTDWPRSGEQPNNLGPNPPPR